MNKHQHNFRVFYADTDQMGVMYHADYIKYLELGRTELLRSCGLVYQELEKKGFITPVINLEVKYVKPAHYDEILTVRTWVSNLKNARIEFSYEIVNDTGDILTIAKTQLVFLDVKTKRPANHFADELKEKINQYIIQ